MRWGGSKRKKPTPLLFLLVVRWSILFYPSSGRMRMTFGGLFFCSLQPSEDHTMLYDVVQSMPFLCALCRRVCACCCRFQFQYLFAATTLEQSRETKETDWWLVRKLLLIDLWFVCHKKNTHNRAWLCFPIAYEMKTWVERVLRVCILFFIIYKTIAPTAVSFTT